jgi:hypothetical protein
MSRSAAEQALEAFIAEAKKAGLDIEKTAMAATSGIMGNSIYSWIPTTEKSGAVKSLKDAISEISKLEKLDT